MQESCTPCKHFKQLGSKYFCYQKGSFLESPSSRCGEFSLKAEGDDKKRVFSIRDEKEAQGKHREEIEVEVKPLGSEEFRLKKEQTKLVSKEFYAKEQKKEEGHREIRSHAAVLVLILLLVFVLLIIIYTKNFSR